MLVIMQDITIFTYYFIRNVEELFIIFVVDFLLISGIGFAFLNYFLSLALYKVIPQEVFVTTDSVISSLSSIAGYVFSIIASLIIVYIGYYTSVIITAILFLSIDIFFIPTFWLKLVKIKENKENNLISCIAI